MILIDFSSIIHRMIHSSVAQVKPKKDENGTYITSEFVGYTKYLILDELFNINQTFGPKYGDLVICLDVSAGGYWRKDVYPNYKSSRKKGREESDINFQEVFEHINELITQLEEHVPWKVIGVNRAEADDIMLVLAREYNPYELILLHTPDKDMIQAQRDNENVHQYSALTRKWIVPENKHETMDHWILEHVCLGDASDEVPKVVDHTEFSPAFLKYLKDQGYNIKDPMEFKSSDLSSEEKRRLLNEFDVYKLNRKKESTCEKDVYKDIRFGPTTLVKEIEKHGSVDGWLDSHPLYRIHYERNFKLVMEEGIPLEISEGILEAFKNAKIEYNDKAFEEYLNNNNLKQIVMQLPNHFKINRDLTADDFGW